jgi:hypothetical protein
MSKTERKIEADKPNLTTQYVGPGSYENDSQFTHKIQPSFFKHKRKLETEEKKKIPEPPMPGPGQYMKMS